MNDGPSPMDTPLTSAARSEKVLWYQEVLSLDPDSRIFLPYARLLSELGRRSEAVDVLKSGLLRHPEFLEARLLLIELLHAAGQDAAAGLEASGIIELLSQCPSLWEIWSKAPGLRADQAAMLLFFGSCLKKGGMSLADVFEAGIQSISASNARHTVAPAAELPSISPCQAPGASSADKAPPSDRSAPSSEKTPLFVMDENTPWYSLDSVPEDEDIPDEDAPAAPTGTSPAVPPLLFPRPVGGLPASEESGNPPGPADVPAEEERVPTVRSVPRTPAEGKSSLCTRSMAHVLEEQGAMGEAAEIYRELLESCSSPEERDELNAKLDSLIQGTEYAASPQPATSGIMEMLETLAARLENKSRA